MATAGTLKLKVVEARLERDCNYLDIMDPYVLLENRYERHRSKTHSNAGKEPVWNWEVELDVKYIGDDLTIEIKDDNCIVADEKIAGAQIKLASLCVLGGLDDWWNIAYKGNKAGAIHLIGEWIPRGEPKHSKRADEITPTPVPHSTQPMMATYMPAQYYQPTYPMAYTQPIVQPGSTYSYSSKTVTKTVTFG